MLTLALTCSRNLSQAFAVSRSRPTCVAVVIGKDKKKTLDYFHRCVKAVESNSALIVSSLLDSWSRWPLFPLCPGRGLLGFVGLLTAALKTARDCLRLTCIGQAKSVRRSSKCCTCHAQVFHRDESVANFHKPFIFQGIPRRNFPRRKNLAQQFYKLPEEIFSHFAFFLSGLANR